MLLICYVASGNKYKDTIVCTRAGEFSDFSSLEAFCIGCFLNAAGIYWSVPLNQIL